MHKWFILKNSRVHFFSKLQEKYVVLLINNNICMHPYTEIFVFGTVAILEGTLEGTRINNIFSLDFPQEIIGMFKYGFPPNWREVISKMSNQRER